jgi:hypothetical protein
MCFWVNGYLFFQPPQNARKSVLYFRYQRNITSIEMAPPSTALVCVPSSAVTNSQNLSSVLVEPSLSTLITILTSDTSLKKLLPPDCWKWVQYWKYPENIKLKKLPFITDEANNIEEKRKKHRGNKVKEQRNRKIKQLQYFRYTRSENAENMSINTDIHNQLTSEDSEKKYYVQTTKEDEWIECASCRKLVALVLFSIQRTRQTMHHNITMRRFSVPIVKV